MFTGVFGSSSYNTQSLADMGAQRALGINGSVTNYINKGTTRNDYVTFSTKNTAQTEQKKKKKFNDAAAATCFSAAAILVGLAVKSKKGGIKSLKTLFSKAKISPDAAKGALDGIKNKLSGLCSKIKLPKK